MCDTTPCTTAQHSCDSRETPSFCHAFSGHALMYREGSAGVGSTHEQLLSWPRLLHVEGVRAQRTGQVTEHAASASEAVLHADKVWILGAGNALLQWNGDASHNRAVEHVVVPHGKPAAARSWRALGMPDRAIGRPSAFSVPSHSICAPMSMPIDRVVPDDRHSSSPKGTRAALRPLSVSGIFIILPFSPLRGVRPRRSSLAAHLLLREPLGGCSLAAGQCDRASRAHRALLFAPHRCQISPSARKTLRETHWLLSAAFLSGASKIQLASLQPSLHPSHCLVGHRLVILEHYLGPHLASPWPLPKPSPSPRVSPQPALCHSSQLASAVASIAATPPWRLGHRLRQGRPQRRFSHHHNHRPDHSYGHRHDHRFGGASLWASPCPAPGRSLGHRLRRRLGRRIAQRLSLGQRLGPRSSPRAAVQASSRAAPWHSHGCRPMPPAALWRIGIGH